MQVRTIKTPSRLHLGLIEIKEDEPHRFGGLGLMIDDPGFSLSATPSPKFDVSACGPWSNRAHAAAERWRECYSTRDLPSISIRVHSAPAAHVGFGTGTQFACAVTALIQSFHSDLAPLSMKSLRETTGRGERSHIGLAGFLEGGVLYDRGKSATDDPSELRVHRIEPPSDWRVLVISPSDSETISGQKEKEYFSQCDTASNRNRDRMRQLIENEILPGVSSSDYERVAESIYAFGCYAGDVFASVQFGSFRTKEIADRVAALRQFGIPAAGQSSWGPIVFGIVEDPDRANHVRKHWSDRHPNQSISCTSMNRGGAHLELELEMKNNEGT